jgi:hypothetical protein
MSGHKKILIGIGICLVALLLIGTGIVIGAGGLTADKPTKDAITGKDLGLSLYKEKNAISKDTKPEEKEKFIDNLKSDFGDSGMKDNIIYCDNADGTNEIYLEKDIDGYYRIKGWVLLR